MSNSPWSFLDLLQAFQILERAFEFKRTATITVPLTHVLVPDCYVAAYRVLAGSDLGADLYQITAPTLVMTGENDIGSNPRMSRFIHDQITASELHILPRLKHSVLLEAPAQIGGLIDPFLTKHID